MVKRASRHISEGKGLSAGNLDLLEIVVRSVRSAILAGTANLAHEEEARAVRGIYSYMVEEGALETSLPWQAILIFSAMFVTTFEKRMLAYSLEEMDDVVLRGIAREAFGLSMEFADDSIRECEVTYRRSKMRVVDSAAQ